MSGDDGFTLQCAKKYAVSGMIFIDLSFVDGKAVNSSPMSESVFSAELPKTTSLPA
ncbi:hypothetical protein [Allofranklinella schreckenbergeri]|uniref:hypothetical protein n=1 Tax=Allofranklinella schreckenbergeri TaxID=1076744 RepID=UPI001EEE2493|nr:hypothetical protein [Allofranklinella schreckenbergeri]